MFRRNQIWCAGLALLLACASAAAQGAQPRPPNLVLVTLDTVRADHMGCYGYARAATPNFDRLAAEGIRFSQAYTPVPITLPSHATIFTGAYPMRTGMHDFSGNRLNAAQPTLASVLRAHGYATAGITGAAVLDRRFGLNQGFDYYYDDFDFSRLDETNLDAMERPGSMVVDRALAWLESNAAKPFFLFVHLYDAHHPYVPPEPYATRFRDRPYDGEIAYVDAQLGRVVAYLKEAKLYDHTVIIVAGDHGEGLGEHGEETHGFFIYNSTMHVPWVIKPAAPAPAKVVDTAVCLVDLMPTALDLLGVLPPAEVQGRSLAPLMRREEKAAASAADTLYMESYLPRLHFNWSELRGIQTGRYKLIDAPKAELYDIERDPAETKNLLNERRAIVRELRKRLGDVIARHSATGDTPTAEKTPLDPILSERLKSLGYVAVSGAGDAVLADRNSPDPKDRIGMYELVSKAIADSQHGHYAEAVAQLKQALAIEPESTPVRHLLGLNYYRMRDWAAAAAEFEQVLQRQPDYALATFYLGLAYARAGEAEKSVAALQRALELDSTNFTAAFNLGAVLLQLRRVPEAAAAFRQAVTIYPRYAAAYEALGEVLLYQQQTDEALTALRKAVELAPANRKARLTLARALDARGLHDEAEEQRRLAGAGPPGQQR